MRREGGAGLAPLLRRPGSVGLVLTLLVGLLLIWPPGRDVPVAPETRALQVERAVQVLGQLFENPDADPLVAVRGEIFARQSNVAGIEVDGTIFYYAIGGHQSFDPLSTGAVAPDEVEVVSHSGGAFPLTVYVLRAPPE